MLDHAEIQAALSARLDGEPTGLDDDVIDTHLAGCEECRDFYDNAAALKRQLNFCVAEPGTRPLTAPDLSEVILAEVEPEWRRRASSRVLSEALTRLLMVVLGLLFAVWGIQMLSDTTSLVTQDDPYVGRLAAEAAIFRFGLAFGLIFAAWKPGLVSGMLPVFGALWTFSLGFAASDLILGTATSDTWRMIALLLASVVVLGWSWLSGYGVAALRSTWRSLGANPS